MNVDTEFLSFDDAAQRMKLSIGTLRARVMDGRYYAFVYVHDVHAYGFVDSPLPPWSDEAFPWTRWQDHGVPLDDNHINPDRRCRYSVSGWVALPDAASVLTRGKHCLYRSELQIPSSAPDWGEYFVTAAGSPFVAEDLVFTPDDLFLMDAQIGRSLRPNESQSPPAGTATVDPSRRIRSQREENLLRVIAGLWELSGQPAEHNVTADKLSHLFDLWGWDGPGKSTIADTILKPARQIARAKT